jgi:hypothetical protein
MVFCYNRLGNACGLAKGLQRYRITKFCSDKLVFFNIDVFLRSISLQPRSATTATKQAIQSNAQLNIRHAFMLGNSIPSTSVPVNQVTSQLFRSTIQTSRYAVSFSELRNHELFATDFLSYI